MCHEVKWIVIFTHQKLIRPIFLIIPQEARLGFVIYLEILPTNNLNQVTRMFFPVRWFCVFFSQGSLPRVHCMLLILESKCTTYKSRTTSFNISVNNGFVSLSWWPLYSLYNYSASPFWWPRHFQDRRWIDQVEILRLDLGKDLNDKWFCVGKYLLWLLKKT